MRTAIAVAFAAIFVACTPCTAADSFPATPASWVQLGPGGTAEARVVPGAGGGCPELIVDGHKVAMTKRAMADQAFPQAVCSLALPDTARSVFLGDRPLPVPPADPKRILVLGDTGCRIKGTAVQACNDPKAWPFPQLTAAAAALKPDLVIHLGDYLYRESACPATFEGCKGSPWGDNWASWDADFFTPAAPLLAAAPWIIVRGNHEDCNRAGPGFLRLLGPGAYDPAAPCAAHLTPYAVSVGGQMAAVMDSAGADDRTAPPDSVATYAKDFEALKALANTGPGHELWLLSHRPVWGVVSVLGAPAGGNATMIAAAGDLSVFNAISLMLAGHIHTFEAINYDDAKVPPQIVAGHGGDNLEVTPKDLRGTIFTGSSGVHVKSGLSVGGFGFLMLTRDAGNEGWTIELYDSHGAPIRHCGYVHRSVFCLNPS
jgi:Calcineurin-like phosphoesterase